MNHVPAGLEIYMWAVSAYIVGVAIGRAQHTGGGSSKSCKN